MKTRTKAKVTNKDERFLRADKSKLLRDTEDILAGMILLRKDAEFSLKLVNDWCKKVDAIPEGSNMLSVATEGKNIISRLKLNYAELRKLDNRYKLVVSDTNSLYGEELLPPPAEEGLEEIRHICAQYDELAELLEEKIKQDSEGEQWKDS